MKNSNIDLLVGIAQIDLNPWKSIYQFGQKPTWISRCPSEIQIVNLFGKKLGNFSKALDQIHETLRLSSVGNGITIRLDRFLTPIFIGSKIPSWTLNHDQMSLIMKSNAPSFYLTGAIREFSLFKYFLEFTSAQYLYVTNTSSYINLKNLLTNLSNLPKEKLYGGTRLFFEDFYFCSGANRIFSRDVVSFLVKNFQELNLKYLNDVAIGHLLKDQNLNFCEISSKTFTTEEEIRIADKQQILETIHFRLKSGTKKRRNDTELMKLVDKILYDSKSY